MTVRVVAFCALTLLALPVAPTSATPAPRTLTVRGAPNSYADVTFATRVRFETDGSSKTPPRYDARGTYAGVYVAPVGRTGAVAGTVLLRGLPELSDVHFPVAPPQWLPAGRYRVHLLGDADTIVRLRVAGLRRDTVVTTARPSPVAARWIDRGVAGVATPVDRTVVPVTVGATTLTVLGEVHESTGFYGRREVCVRKRSNELSPCLEGNAGRSWYSGVYPVQWTMGGAAAYHPGELPPGDYEAEFFDATVGVPHAYRTFLLTLN